MKNKKVVLSVLSAAVVSSMATSAFAAPSAGVYLGGEVDKYYKMENFIHDAFIDAFGAQLDNVAPSELVYVTEEGTAITLQGIIDNDDWEAALEEINDDNVADFFGDDTTDEFTVVGEDGKDTDETVTPGPIDPDGPVVGDDVVADVDGSTVVITGTVEKAKDVRITVGEEEYLASEGAENFEFDAETGEFSLTLEELEAGDYEYSVVAINDDAESDSFDDTFTIDGDVELPAVESVSAIDPITVPNKTTAEEAIAKLPAKVTVTLDDEEATTKEVAVTWAAPAGYDPAAGGEFTFEGTLAESEEFENPDGLKATAKVTVEAPAVELKVESVTATNLLTFTVNFNAELDKGAAQRATNYQLSDGVAISDAYLSEDGKSVTLVSAGLADSKEYTLTLNNLKDAKGNALANGTTTKVKAVDSTIPTFKSVKSLGSSTLQVEFAEPIQSPLGFANFELDGTALAAGTVTATDATNTVFNIALTTPIAAGAHKLKTAGTIVDYAGYQVPVKENTFTVADDLNVPTVQKVEVVDQRKIKVTFNKAVNLDESVDYSDNFAFSEYSNGAAHKNADALNTVTAVDSSNTAYYVNFTGPNALAAGKTLYFAVDAAGLLDGNGTTEMVDFSGNAVKDSLWTITGTATADPVAKVTEAKSANDSSVTVYFDRPVNPALAQSAANFELKNAAGTDVITTTGIYVNNTDNKGYRVIFGTSSVLPGGTYTISYANLKDGLGNVIANGTVSVTVTDTTVLTSFVASGTTNVVNGEQVVYVDFNENMKFEGPNSVLNTANYEFDVDSTDHVYTAIPATHAIVATKINDKRVKLTIKPVTGTVQLLTAAGFDIRVKLVADAAGNVIPTFVSDESVTLTPTSTPIDVNNSSTVVGIEYAAKNQLKVKLLGQFDTATTGDFVVYNTTSASTYATTALLDATLATPGNRMIGQSGAAVAYDFATNTSTFTLNLAEEINTAKGVYVAVSPNPVTKNTLGLAFTANEVLSTLGDVNADAAINKIPPVITGISYQDKNHLVVTLDKALSLAVASDFKATVGNATYAADAVIAGVDPAGATAIDTTSSTTYVLEFASDITPSATVTLVAAPQSEDAAGNKLVIPTTALTLGDFKVTSVNLVNKTGGVANTAEAGDKIVITFNNAVDASTLVPDKSLLDGLADTTAWDGSMALTAAATKVKFTNATDTIDFSGINLPQIALGATTAVGADADDFEATVALSADGKTLTITLGTSDTELAAGVVAGDIAGANTVLTVTDNGTLQDVNGNYINVEYKVYTATKF